MAFFGVSGNDRQKALLLKNWPWSQYCLLTGSQSCTQTAIHPKLSLWPWSCSLRFTPDLGQLLGSECFSFSHVALRIANIRASKFWNNRGVLRTFRASPIDILFLSVWLEVQEQNAGNLRTKNSQSFRLLPLMASHWCALGLALVSERSSRFHLLCFRPSYFECFTTHCNVFFPNSFTQVVTRSLTR